MKEVEASMELGRRARLVGKVVWWTKEGRRRRQKSERIGDGFGLR